MGYRFPPKIIVKGVMSFEFHVRTIIIVLITTLVNN